ncbi:MAG: hypothetical protein ACYDEV_14925 [Acidiferrobacter sp.]
MLTEERKKLTHLAKPRTTIGSLARRAQRVLCTAIGKSVEVIAQALGVGRWRARYTQGGLAAITQNRPGADGR